MRNPEWLSLCLKRRRNKKNKEQEDYSPHTGAGLHLLESNLCWPQLCLLAWLTFCSNLWLAAPDPGNQIPWSCIYTLTPSCEARSDPHVCWVHPALELPIALPGLSDRDPATPQEAPGGRAHTLPLLPGHPQHPTGRGPANPPSKAWLSRSVWVLPTPRHDKLVQREVEDKQCERFSFQPSCGYFYLDWHHLSVDFRCAGSSLLNAGFL